MKKEDLENYEQISRQFAELGDRIDRAIDEGFLVNTRETILKWQNTDFQTIQKIKQQFTPYFKVWGLKTEFQNKIPNIMESYISKVDRDEETKFIQDSFNELFKLEKTTFK